MEQLSALFLRVLTVSAGCSAVLAPLLLLSGRLRKKIAARSLYVLFLILALRLLLPVDFKLPAPAVTVPTPDYTVSVPVPRPEPNVVQVQPVLDPVVSPEPVRKIPVLHILGLVWLLGAAGCVLCSAGGFLLARRRLLKGSVPADIDLEPLRQELGVRRPVRTVYSTAAPCPLALGLLRPVIVLPAGLEQVDELVLRHELTHIRRWDVAYKLVLSLACWVNWFNPFVWLMDRAAGRNLELCCDDEVTRDLSDAERRRYGNLLLDAAAVRSIPFSTCFSGGKNQMKERLLNLFAHKRNSAALVGLVLIAALLAGGLVACEQTPAAETPSSPDAEPMGASPSPTGSPTVQLPTGSPAAQMPTDSPDNEARRALLKDYFYANFQEDTASVVLADLTGDGLDEMMVLTVYTFDESIAERDNVTAENFAYSQWQVIGVKDGTAFQYNSIAGVSNSHVGWGYEYLVPRSDGNGFALLDFRAYTGDGQASYSYCVDVLDEQRDEWLHLDSDNVYFHLIPENADSASLIMGEDVWTNASAEEVEQLLSRVQTYKNSGVPLLVLQPSYLGITGEQEFSYLNTAPADVFSGAVTMDVSSLSGHVVAEGGPMTFALPNPPTTPEEALELLNASAQAANGMFVFRIPNYDGEWNIHIAGRMRMWDEDSQEYMSAHYLEGEEWVPGKRYSFQTNGAYFDDLTLTATVTCHDGTQAEHSICLEGTDDHALVHHEEHHDTVPTYTPSTHHPEESHHSEYHH